MQAGRSRYALDSVIIFVILELLCVCAAQAQPNIQYRKQGYSTRLCLDNRGSFGRVCYPGVVGGFDPGPDSVGLAYPMGQPYEHIFGAGLWVGGKLDTAQIGIYAPVRTVATAYEGWNGPYFEFFPGNSPADSIWQVSGRGVQRPPSWDEYWGNSISRVSFSDNDHYCRYDDEHVNIAGHIRLRTVVVQSAFVWNGAYGEAIHIVEYKIINKGAKQIDSAYVGVFLDGEVGPYYSSNYWQRNYSGYYPDLRTAYIHNPVDVGSTPVGVSVLGASRPLDSLRYSFRWWPGPSHPLTDADRYLRLSSERIDSNQSLVGLSETRCLISIGPFTLLPPSNPNHDTLLVAFGIVSGQNLSVMRLHAERAKAIYLNGGQVSVDPRGNETASRFELFQNYPNPFNPVTTIRFAVPLVGFTKLIVFDVLGAEVATLVSVDLPAGHHSVRWDASNRPSGVYFYRLESGTLVKTKKLILVR